ncbi:VOC family protein [Phreatobacter stygius]|uniref:Oxidoreductase n=1 Tax=Phreatobacter stygius TaxID=1940610 RepID=A0A4D7B0J8_9HYPH|nr:VOC family protein [Phreatobacter stygius]QCI67174.1 oxidoreductase [Phreatobacter stygius]
MTDTLNRIPIEQLRYVRLGTADLNGATDFAQRILGLQLVNRTETEAYFRSDYRDHTLVYVAGDPSHQAVGFELRDPETLDRAVAALEAQGFMVGRDDGEGAQRRKARRLASFRMPGGYDVELVVRPLQSGWRYHGPRDAGMTGLEGVALRGAPDASDQDVWTRLLSGAVSDWVGEAAYIRFDEAHHRIAVHPSEGRGVLAVEFGVEDVDLIMQNAYFLRAAQVRIVDGPGRRPFSNQLFVTFAGPDGVLFSYVCEGERFDGARRARQFPRARGSFCAWGSETAIAEYQ